MVRRLGASMPLATRVIPVILFSGQSVYKPEKFGARRVIGSLRQAIRVYENRGVDELCLLSIDGSAPDLALVSDVAAEIFAPLAVGGGITCLEEFGALVNHGADKVVINSGAVNRPGLITQAAHKFGAQAVTVAVDVGSDGAVHINSGRTPTGLHVVDWAREVEQSGAGEILLTSIPRDGTLEGYDLDLIRSVSEAVTIPVIACGGAGEYQHFLQALEAGAHAVAAGACFAFTDMTPRSVAQYLANHGVPVRVAA